MMAECERQPSLCGSTLLVGACRQAQRITRMVIHYCQRVTALACGQRLVALEIHLPEEIRRWIFEAPGRGTGRFAFSDPAMALQNGMHRRAGRRIETFTFKNLLNLTSAPGRMRIADLQHRRLDLSRATSRAVARSAREIRRPLASSRSCTVQPLVGRRSTDAKPSTQLATVRSFLHSQCYKLTPLIHGRHLFPRHGNDPPLFHAEKCQPCPRTPVSDVSGLNNKHGHDIRVCYSCHLLRHRPAVADVDGLAADGG